MAPKYPCIVCKKGVRTNSQAVCCDVCKLWCHTRCNTGISRERYLTFIADDDFDWTCCLCSRRSPSPQPPTPPGSPEVEIPQSPATPARPETPVPDTYDDFMDTLDYPAPPRPDSLQESNLADPDPIDTLTDQHITTYRLVTKSSTRGKDKLFDSIGYTYTLKRRTGQSTTWRCPVRSKSSSCPATVKQVGDDFFPSDRGHTHEPKPGACTAASIARVSKDIAQEQPFRSAADIVGDLVKEYLPINAPCPALPSMTRLAANANHHRRKNRPDHPRDLDFELLQDHIPDDFLQADIHVDDARHILLCTEHQLQLLSNAKTWYFDATFKVVKKPFYQLFSVNAFVRHDDSLKQLPLALCLMSRRLKEDYVAVLQRIVDLLPNHRVQRCFLDFEKAEWQSIRHVLPEVERRGCAFHFTQAVWRKIQTLGLQGAYTSDDGTYKLLRKLMALCYLPEQHIPAIFRRLATQATTDPIKQLFSYFEKNWLQSSIWPPSSWSVYTMAIRTNNDLEGWHNRLNQKGRPGMNFYMLVLMLHEEATSVPIQARLVSENKLKQHQKKTYRQTQQQLFKLWEEYEEGDKSALQLLTAASRLYGPIVNV